MCVFRETMICNLRLLSLANWLTICQVASQNWSRLPLQCGDPAVDSMLNRGCRFPTNGLRGSVVVETRWNRSFSSRKLPGQCGGCRLDSRGPGNLQVRWRKLQKVALNQVETSKVETFFFAMSQLWKAAIPKLKPEEPQLFNPNIDVRTHRCPLPLRLRAGESWSKRRTRTPRRFPTLPSCCMHKGCCKVPCWKWKGWSCRSTIWRPICISTRPNVEKQKAKPFDALPTTATNASPFTTRRCGMTPRCPMNDVTLVSKKEGNRSLQPLQPSEFLKHTQVKDLKHIKHIVHIFMSRNLVGFGSFNSIPRDGEWKKKNKNGGTTRTCVTLTRTLTPSCSYWTAGTMYVFTWYLHVFTVAFGDQTWSNSDRWFSYWKWWTVPYPCLITKGYASCLNQNKPQHWIANLTIWVIQKNTMIKRSMRWA